MPARFRVLFCTLLLITCAASPGIRPVFAAEHPNVLFILTEDQGSHLSLLKTPGLQTPRIDALAKSGVYFPNAFVAYPVCSASKAAFYTGLHSHTNGILNNTPNFHKPASKLTPAENAVGLYQRNRVKEHIPTMIEILKSNGYYQGVTHKLHVAPNEKFPYDEFLHGSRAEITAFLNRAAKRDQPWFLMVNIPNSHRPYPNSDKESIRVKPSEVQLPGFLPDSPAVRKDWAEYLAGVEEADRLTGEALDALKASGEEKETVVIFMSDHGPTFQHGKMTLYDLGLRVPLIICGPGIPRGVTSPALVSELDLLPTLLELMSTQGFVTLPKQQSIADFNADLHGVSLANILSGSAKNTDPDQIGGHEFIFAEISNRGPLPNDGMQERSVFDGRYKLIVRWKTDRKWRQVNADSREFRIWGNRTYAETVRLKDQFPTQYRILTEMDPQTLNGTVPRFELYDLQNDPDELTNLYTDPESKLARERLTHALNDWIRNTKDESVSTLAE